MKYSELKAIRAFCDDLFSTPDWREVATNIENGDDDFEVDGVRFIKSGQIDRIQQEELANDEYILGCFNAGFLAGILDIDYEVIAEMQKAKAYTALGKLILSLGKLEKLQEAYASADGYGHHFNSYDGSEEELNVDSAMYHVFDNH